MAILINEDLARQAKQMSSFNDYIEGSATERYNNLVIAFKANVEELKQKYPQGYERNKEKIEYLIERYEIKLANAINRENQISCYCPSIMITGAGNFPVRKKEKQINMMENFWRENGDLFSTNNYIFNKIEAMITNKTIYSNDEFAIEKLQDKLNELETIHKKMKEANAHYKKFGTMFDFDELTNEEVEKIDAVIKKTWYNKPYADFELTNSNATIKNVKERIEILKKMKSVETKYEKIDGIEVKENKELMRIQLFFESKPNDEVRELLKSKGFRWAPSERAWQRQLTENGIRATQNILGKLGEK